MDYALKKHIENRKQVDRIFALVDQLADEVNVLGSHQVFEEAFSSALIKQHRTLQQSLVGNLIQALRRYGDTSGTDARNEAAVKHCQNLEEVHFPLV